MDSPRGAFAGKGEEKWLKKILRRFLGNRFTCLFEGVRSAASNCRTPAGAKRGGEA